MARDPPQEGEGAIGRRERQSTGSKVRMGFRVVGAGAAGGQEGGWSNRLGKMLDGGFRTLFADQSGAKGGERTHSSRVLAVFKGYRSQMPTLCLHCANDNNNYIH